MIYHEHLSQLSEHGLRSYDTLPNITAPDWSPTPLVVERIETDQLIMAVGVKHLGEPGPENPQYVAVRDGFVDFEVVTRGLRRIIVVEGDCRKIVADPDQAYRQGTEASMTVSLAVPYGIDQRCFEPEKFGAEELLRQGFSKQDIAMYLLGRYLPVWDRRMRAADPNQRKSFESWMAPTLERLRTELGWAEFDAYQNMAQLYQDIYNETFDPEDPAIVQSMLIQSVGYMLEPTSSVHEVAIAANQGRDLRLALGIASLWREGYSIFVPFGYPHIGTLQDFIRGLRPNARNVPSLAEER